MANECTPLFRPGWHVTARATAQLTGKRFVGISADLDDDGVIRVGLPAAGARTFGVAAHDAATGTVLTILRRGIIPVTAGGTITAGQEVQVDNVGRVVTLAAGVSIGQAVENATTGQDVAVALG